MSPTSSVLDPDLVAQLAQNPATRQAALAFLDAWAVATFEGATPIAIIAAASAAWDSAVAEQRQDREGCHE
jgi:hypothetical protein